MSCTIGAIPFLLIYGAITVLSSTTELSSNYVNDSESVNDSIKDSIKAAIEQNNGEATPEMIEMICKDYQTVFMDKELLLKTLEEYGFDDFSFDNDKIKCSLEGFVLEFERESEKSPYNMKVSCAQGCEESVIVTDLNSEYGLNTQEETYIKIKERLANKNLKIDEEEVLEDDSIVLTINID